MAIKSAKHVAMYNHPIAGRHFEFIQCSLSLSFATNTSAPLAALVGLAPVNTG
jgi:hypothetical protein